ncbi:hypothetical protein H1P_520021 [Hyella patelloides LEGE 07179]|uniref:DEP domain-containing protein n=1 Tax=Hyella patelloides LEGE 07179 TaxID=945734 RepID=A0A563VZY6_9CYAN|nr:hypothetical protein [Hyella patelloides]VEP16980.1 hypothetical protein H1P_520021 [Hyella patelloides LEGE 07179]
MNIISVDEFSQQTTPGDSRLQKRYQGRILIQGPVFALDQKASAVQYCQTYLKKHSKSLCLLVQEEYYFQLWKEESVIQNKKNTTLSSYKNEDLTSQDKNKLSVQQANTQTLNTKSGLEFISLCQELLSKSVGPIGSVICQRTLSQNPNLNCQEFVENLAQKIPDSQQSQQFEQTLLQFINKNIGLTISLKEISAQIKKDSQEIEMIATINLEKLVTKMRNLGGIKIKNRRYNLRTYSNCFIGKEAVDWMVNNLNLSPEQSVKLGQRLIDEGFIHHVVERKNFENEYLFYRFYWDEV